MAKKPSDYEYKYRKFSMNMTPSEVATITNAIDIIRNHYPDRFEGRQLRSIPAFCKAVAVIFSQKVADDHKGAR